jgi:hypothetical protein
MKKTLLPAVILLMFLSSTTFAQLPFKLGARVGLNIANLSFSPDLPSAVDKSSRIGFKFGAAAELGFIPMFAVQIEPMYVMKGAKFSANGAEETFKYSYLEIPILLKLKIPTPGPVTPYAFAGPNIGIFLSGTDEYTGGSEDLKDFTSSVDFALDIGAGVSFDIAPFTSLLIDARYSLGLSNIFNDKGQLSWQQLTGQSSQSVKTTGIQIVAGVMFGL